jgi:hypothetical protein
MRHQHISFIKSALRIIGYCYLPFYLGWGVAILVVSEMWGIVEEIGHE